MIRKFEHDAVVHVNTTLETIEVAPDLHVFRRTRRSQATDAVGDMALRPSELTNVQDSEGFLDGDNLRLMKSGQDWEARRLRILLPEGRELLRVRGFPWVDWDEITAQMPARPFTAFEAGGLAGDDVVNIDISNHRLFTHDGDVLPTALWFDYLDGNISDKAYDLRRLAEHLMSRDDVRVHKPRNRLSDEPDRLSRATTVDEAILRIPSYNGGGETIAFIWMPDEAAMRDVHERASERKGKEDIHSWDLRQAVFDTDALGFRAAGAALFEDFHASNPREPSEDEEDGFRP